ncbi:MAG TPA: DUF423 domain-containing protein [Planctomycetes bacterium]|nr:DUF423 domain-containing protein [Planctomycetota bacterium]
MSPRTTILAAALLAALAVGLGAGAAHALHDTLDQRDQLANWNTAVRYQMWHALALLVLGFARETRPGLRFACAALLVGSVLFSGSIYCLAFGVLRPVMGPLTPLGGVTMLAGWISVASWALRRGPTQAA